VYVGEVQDVQVATSGKGNQYYAVKFVVAPEEIPADIVDAFEDGAVLYWNRQIKPTAKDRRALYNLRRFVEALGLDSNTTSINPNEWMGCQAKLRVRLNKNPNTGEMQAQIQSVDSVEAQAAQPAERAGVQRQLRRWMRLRRLGLLVVGWSRSVTNKAGVGFDPTPFDSNRSASYGS